MKPLRILAGLACIAGGLLLIVVLLATGNTGSSASPALMAHLPPVAFGLGLLAIGVWLLWKGNTPR